MKNDRWVDLALTLNGLAYFCCVLMALGDNKFSVIPAFFNIGVMGLIIRFSNIHFKEGNRNGN